ncbi:uncharacterized protein ATC70_011444 [Mucor velutinosus]|uniref:Uncharacterized protein n=1 Tax=Mucor velutinosus TaxID=708070 RepID=A0AAN7I1F3_9FUNG|nr:hypothetical protein ATC70_011444 [Mucor velutinosus]
MHPIAVIAIIVGGAFVFWGGYEAVNTLYEWHQDRKEQREYEEYVRMYNEKSQYVPVPLFNNDEDEDEDEDEDNEPLGIWKQKRDSLRSSELRQRKPNSNNEEPLPNYEFSEMERSISNRKSFLQRETEQLIKEEAELQRSRELLRSKGNSITGVIHDEEDANPFSDDFFIERSASPSPLLPSAVDKSDCSWSDLEQDKASDSAESFESIHHNQL